MRTSLLPAVAALLAATVVPTPAHALENAVEPTCTYVYKSVPDTYDIYVVLIAEAHATGPGVAVTTSVTCVLENAYHDPRSLQNQIVASSSMPGAHAYAVSSGVMRWSSPTMCGDASALFLDGVVTTERVDAPQRCRQVGA